MHPLWRLRATKQLTQTELAARAGLSNSYISRIENGKKQPSARTVGKLARALDLSVQEFLNYSKTGDNKNV